METIELAELASNIGGNGTLFFIILLMMRDHKEERSKFLTIIKDYVKENK